MAPARSRRDRRLEPSRKRAERERIAREHGSDEFALA
jgi:hypothetical protein